MLAGCPTVEWAARGGRCFTDPAVVYAEIARVGLDSLGFSGLCFRLFPAPPPLRPHPPHPVLVDSAFVGARVVVS